MCSEFQELFLFFWVFQLLYLFFRAGAFILLRKYPESSLFEQRDAMTPAGTYNMFPIPTCFDTADGYACANIVSASRAEQQSGFLRPILRRSAYRIRFRIHRQLTSVFPFSSINISRILKPGGRAFVRGEEMYESASIQRFKLNIQAYQPITHNI